MVRSNTRDSYPGRMIWLQQHGQCVQGNAEDLLLEDRRVAAVLSLHTMGQVSRWLMQYAYPWIGADHILELAMENFTNVYKVSTKDEYTSVSIKILELENGRSLSLGTYSEKISGKCIDIYFNVV